MLDIERRLDSAKRLRSGYSPSRERSHSGHRSLPDSLNDRYTSISYIMY